MSEDNMVCFDDCEPFENVAKVILDKCMPDYIILFKASRAVGLERAVEAFEKLIEERNG
jgi:thymidylate kinase